VPIGRETPRMKKWTVNHFSQANPKGSHQGDVPRLLRRVAKSIDDLGPLDVQDITFGSEITADGEWHHLTVYYHPKKTKRAPTCG
jgi:hypothetical protein